MIRIEDLLHSLANVIVRYHDTFIKKDTPSEAQSREKAIALLKNKQLSVIKDELSAMITSCTKGYDKRSHFLCYILNEVMFLKEIFDREKPLNPDEFLQYQAQIIQMLNNFSALLQKKDSSNHTVRYSTMKKDSVKDISLAGLVQYYSNLYCKSGLLLEDLFKRRNTTPTAPKARFIEITHKMCEEHQNLVRANYAEKQVKELTDKLAKATTDVAAQTKEITALKAELAKAKADAAEQAKKLIEELAKAKAEAAEQAKKPNEELAKAKADAAEQAKKLIEELAKAKADAAAQIKELTARLEQANAAPKPAQTTPKPVFAAGILAPGSVFFGGSYAKWKANQGSAPTTTVAPTSEN